MALLLPQFFLPPAGRMAYGMLFFAAAVGFALIVFSRRRIDQNRSARTTGNRTRVLERPKPPTLRSEATVVRIASARHSMEFEPERTRLGCRTSPACPGPLTWRNASLVAPARARSERVSGRCLAMWFKSQQAPTLRFRRSGPVFE